MTQPSLSGDTQAMIAAIQENAERLGLTWAMRLATVQSGANPAAVSAIFDSDEQPIDMVSTIGPLGRDQRVYVAIVPPGGNFIIGAATENAMTYAIRKTLTSSASSITMLIPSYLTTVDVHWTLRSDEGPGVAATVSMTIDNITAAGYITRTWQVANASGSAGTHSQVFGSTSSIVGIYPTAAATAGRYGGGWIRFPAWNDPHTGSINWTFQSDEETSSGGGAFLTGGGVLTSAGPYDSIQLLPGAAGNFVSGSQVTVIGNYAPLVR